MHVGFGTEEKTHPDSSSILITLSDLCLNHCVNSHGLIKM